MIRTGEYFLQKVWEQGWFEMRDLCTTDGRPVQIVSRGEWNHNAGPDFLNARIRIEDQVWAGQVEIHIRSADWMHHGHQNDPAFVNTVLHVVLEDNQPVVMQSGERLACIELANRIPRSLYPNFEDLCTNLETISCNRHQPESFHGEMERMKMTTAGERLSEKTAQAKMLIDSLGGDREQAFFIALCRQMGFKVNAEPMEQLARSIPLHVVARNADDPEFAEALLFGQAGLLHRSYSDEYPKKLCEKYTYIRHKYGFTPLKSGVWKFMRMRPANFPTLRLAQVAVMLKNFSNLYAAVMEQSNNAKWSEILHASPSEYWHTHYRFDEPVSEHRAVLGTGSAALLLNNVFLPFQIALDPFHEKVCKERALSLLKNSPAEDHRIIRLWKSLGIPCQNAFDSQALTTLYQNYCKKKRCPECQIGMRIISI